MFLLDAVKCLFSCKSAIHNLQIHLLFSFSFTTASLPYDETPSHNFDDSDIQISELSTPKLPKATAPSAFLTNSMKKDLPSSYLIKVRLILS